MDYLQNHIWCSASNWDDGFYSCRHLVSLSSYKDGYEDDWNNIIDPVADHYYDTVSYERMLAYFEEKGLPVDEDCRKELYESFRRNVKNLKPHVLQWLESNVADRPNPPSGESSRGWCIGNNEYRAIDSSSSFSVFFHRKRDAMAFIKKFSQWKKPIHYCQYFTDVRKELNLDTMKYE